MTEPARVLIVEDDEVFSRYMVEALSRAPDIVVAATAASLADGLTKLAVQPDLVLLDLGLPDGSALPIIEALRAQNPKARVLVITVFEDRASVLKTLRAGADGYVLKDTGPDKLIEWVRATLGGETPVSPRAAGHLLSLLREDEPPAEASPPSPLSAREQQLLELIAQGLSRKEAARVMGISPYTVAEYIQGIYRKLSVRSRGAAVREGIHSGLISGSRPTG
ncbi:response regulator [Asticcacaulis biprosthecium C19]|uniref:Response regulator n=1 Tax=Asticcacaulis biprosthecium C19 TaxID=715226 RepID=F4QIL3_9CAUL|nr:response regulator transcription factor [Asticcacaulis biprosthecium]EGF93002.1 response regulator [Asticcacaulis biprosthecium C19]